MGFNLINGKKIQATEKRGGIRKPLKRKVPKNSNLNIYHDNKTIGVLSKRLGTHKFLIATDCSPGDLFALTMWTAWIKENESFFDAGNTFPIYGFIVPNNDSIDKVNKFLTEFMNIMGWNGQDHHLYKNYLSAKNRIWTVNNLETAQTEIKTVKPTNLFGLYLQPELLKNIDLNNICCVSPSINLNGYYHNLNGKLLNGRVFKELEEYENHSLLTFIREELLKYNDKLYNDLVSQLEELEEFKDIDFDDNQMVLNLSDDLKVRYKQLEQITELITNDMNIIELNSVYVILTMLMISGNMKDVQSFKLENNCLLQTKDTTKFIEKIIVKGFSIIS
jgi:frataxin-like iron-binding protein CyaY